MTLLAGSGLNAYRFGIERARIEPVLAEQRLECRDLACAADE